ncbi:MAG: NAD(P)/FAD-dependent oxidoreductase, partial [Hyphomicrobiales bacterium]|nr:NAD(P)/FAD-dependent oxidoreductase [Hyphomicrobiales bacterium]
MSETAASKRLSKWLSVFGQALKRGDFETAASMFATESYWRDLVAFTWNIKTAEGREAIADMLEATLASARPDQLRLEGEAIEADGVTEGWFTFETRAARGHEHIRLKGDKCWTLLTAMNQLKGHEERAGPTREKGVEHGSRKERKTWLDRKTAEEAELGRKRQPYCLIVGGGQAGIGLGARLKRLGVPTLIIDKHERPGDQWRKRYKSLCLHDPVWYDHMPYLPFPEHWPVFSPKDKIGDWLEMYTKVMELNYWPSTECRSATYDEKRGEWTVKAKRGGKTITLKPKQLILATGMSGVPNLPDFPGARRFRGVQHHSSEHPGGEAYKGKKCVVIGSNNSAHDICADLWEHGADVTMVQRSSTHVARSDTLMELGLGALYSEAAVKSGITTE